MTESASTFSTHAWSLEGLGNIGHSLTETAKRLPDSLAVAVPQKKQAKQLSAGQAYRYDTLTFAELEAVSNQIANGLGAQGIEPGMRVALLVPPGIEFVSQVFALFKAGAIVILIDPGMGKKNMIQCLADAQPVGMVGIPKAHLARTILRHKFPQCRHNFVVSGWFPGCHRTAKFRSSMGLEFASLDVQAESEAAIIFTTGSTGPPKGVLYRHRNFLQQCQQIQTYFQIEPGSCDVSGFPLFALFNTAMGTTTIFPEMDPTRPAEVHPPNIIDAVTQFNANQSFGSPALWNTVSRYCEQHSIQLPQLKRILSAGAPVPPDVLARMKHIIHEHGDAFTPYGATEALPVACNSASVVINETAALTAMGRGTCVGHKFPDIDWRIIRISDEILKTVDDTETVEQGEIGELMVRGPVVTDQYVTRTDANAEHKVNDGDSFWHRMGDVGYFDKQGRFWFCGRKTHRVRTETGTLFTVSCEAIINNHGSVYRCALVGVGEPGKETPVLIVEPLDKTDLRPPKSQVLLQEIREMAAQHESLQKIQHFLLHPALPVDIRHNSKIFREQLRGWAKDRIEP